MKKITFIIAFFIGLTAFGQEEVEQTEPKKADDVISIICGTRGGTVYFIDGIKERPLNTEGYFVLTTKIIQPTQTNEQPNGTMPLSKELPFVHTLRGSVYTADYLKYTVRN